MRLRRGTLIAVHPGVYRVGHRAPSVEAGFSRRYGDVERPAAMLAELRCALEAAAWRTALVERLGADFQGR